MKDTIRRILNQFVNESQISEERFVWTDDEIRKEAKKYDRLADFNKLSKKASSAAYRRGKEFYDDVTSHMTKDYYKFWSDDDLRDEAKKYTSITDFQKSSPSAENSARSRGKDFFN